MLPASAVRLSGQGAAPGVVAIRNATILTVTRGTIANGTVLIRDGKIAAVGTNVQIPAGADVYDGTGKFVSPGIIDAHSHIANDAINEGAIAGELDDRHGGRAQSDRLRTSTAISRAARRPPTSSTAAPIRSAARPS